MSNLENNKQLTRDFFSALGTLDQDKLLKILDPKVIFNVPNISCLSGALTLSDLPMITDILGGSCINGIHFEILDMTAEDDRVSCRVDGFAKLKEGGEYNNRYHFLLRIKNEKIIETHEYMDSLLVENTFASKVKNT